MPTSHVEVESKTPVLLCESVIVGKVPDTFLQGGLTLGSSRANNALEQRRFLHALQRGKI